MSRFQHPTVDKLNYLQKLSSAEKLVLDVIADEIAEPSDISAIAAHCSLTKLQAEVALQLLMYKKLIPGKIKMDKKTGSTSDKHVPS